MTGTTDTGRVPRKIPFANRLVILLSGTFAAWGWAGFCFVVVFFFIFGMEADYSSLFVMRGELNTSQGTVTSVDKTHFSIGGGHGHPGTPIYAYDYHFKFKGMDYEGISYYTGAQRANSGDKVTVEFVPDRPDYARIRGMRRAPFSGTVGVIMALVSLVPLILVIIDLLRGVKNLRLVSRGRIAEGKLTNRERTSVKVNNQWVYKLSFEFTDFNGEAQRAVVKTNAPENLEGSAPEQLFYDLHRPARAAFLHNLPGRQVLSETGELKPCAFGAVFKAFAPPAFALLFVLGGIYLRVH